MNKSTLLEKGFKETTINLIFTLDIGRDRSIQIGSLGTIYESLYLSRKDVSGRVTDMITVHYSGFDGPLTEEKLDLILSIFA